LRPPVTIFGQFRAPYIALWRICRTFNVDNHSQSCCNSFSEALYKTYHDVTTRDARQEQPCIFAIAMELIRKPSLRPNRPVRALPLMFTA